MNVQQEFQKSRLVPDILTTAPKEPLTITYPCGAVVEWGKELTPTQVKDKPVIKWDFKEGSYYTLCMTDPDAPSREKPKFREWHHWLIANILNNNINDGEVLSDYIGSGPPKGTGLHRYVFLLYRQQQKVDFSDVDRLPSNSSDKRGKFSISKFAAKYNLGVPIAGNYFQAKYDNYVPKLYAQLKS